MNCSSYNCDKEAKTRRGLCTNHYKAEWRRLNPDKHKEHQKKYYKKNIERRKLTNAKYYKNNIEQARATGRRNMAKNSKNPVTEEHITDRVKERFFAKVDKTDACWNWTGAKTAARPQRRFAGPTDGYGCININGRPFYAHRASWLMHNGPLIKGLVIDHLCDNTLCVNPEHIQQVTNNENTQRSPKHPMNHGGYNHHKEFCLRGHKRGIEMKGKPCPECDKERQRRKRHG